MKNEKLYEEYVERLRKGEKLVKLFEVGTDFSMLTILRAYPVEEWEEKLGYHCAYGALREAAGFDIMQEPVPDKFKAGDTVSIYDIAGEKILRIQREREEEERQKREIEEFVKKGGTVLYLNRCWECGSMQIIGGKWSGGEGRLPYGIYKRAKDLLTEATKKQWEHDSQGGNVCLASIGADIVFQKLEKAGFKPIIISEDASQCCGG